MVTKDDGLLDGGFGVRAACRSPRNARGSAWLVADEESIGESRKGWGLAKMRAIRTRWRDRGGRDGQNGIGIEQKVISNTGLSHTDWEGLGCCWKTVQGFAVVQRKDLCAQHEFATVRRGGSIR